MKVLVGGRRRARARHRPEAQGKQGCHRALLRAGQRRHRAGCRLRAHQGHGRGGHRGLAAAEKMDYVVVTPDDPLCLGLVDLLAARGIPAFGPDRAAARIEAARSLPRT